MYASSRNPRWKYGRCHLTHFRLTRQPALGVVPSPHPVPFVVFWSALRLVPLPLRPSLRLRTAFVAVGRRPGANGSEHLAKDVPVLVRYRTQEPGGSTLLK